MIGRSLNSRCSPGGGVKSTSSITFSFVADETLHARVGLSIFELGPKQFGFELCPRRVPFLIAGDVARLDDSWRRHHPPRQLNELARPLQFQIAGLRGSRHLRLRQ